MKDSIYVSKENYLKAILEAEAEGHQVIPATLAHWLEVSAPAVTMALKRLKRDGYVEVGDDGIVRLTLTGRETAYHTALRHHLIPLGIGSGGHYGSQALEAGWLCRGGRRRHCAPDLDGPRNRLSHRSPPSPHSARNRLRRSLWLSSA